MTDSPGDREKKEGLLPLLLLIPLLFLFLFCMKTKAVFVGGFR